MTFDPVQYKSTTRQQWEDAAEAWHRWAPVLETWLGPATEKMLDAAHVTTGSRVLDVAAGAGGQTLAAARRVGPGGHVLTTDISPRILAYAAQVTAEAGLTNVETREADGEALDGLPGGILRCRDLPSRAHLLSRSAGRPRRSRSSGRQLSSRHPSGASQDPSASARRVCLTRP